MQAIIKTVGYFTYIKVIQQTDIISNQNHLKKCIFDGQPRSTQQNNRITCKQTFIDGEVWLTVQSGRECNQCHCAEWQGM